MTNPCPEHHYDGISLNPLELLFIKGTTQATLGLTPLTSFNSVSTPYLPVCSDVTLSLHYPHIPLTDLLNTLRYLVTVKQRFVKHGWDNVMMALQYDEWTKDKG